jgi:alpha-galactosidase
MLQWWGDLGYELDLFKMTDEEKETVKRQMEDYKEIRHTVQLVIILCVIAM